MKLILLISSDCPSCREAETVWAAVCAELGLPLTCLNADEPAGRRIVEQHGLGSLPVLIINDAPVQAGVPDMQTARELLEYGTRR